MMTTIRSVATLVAALPMAAVAQDCSIPFVVPQFEVRTEMDIPYGSAIRYNGSTAELALDLFKPTGDGQTDRPLLVMVHGGGFTGGSRADLHDYCEGMASMGWAAATISYRLGFYGTGLFEPPYAYDPNEVRRAIYRSMQDVKGAVRFLKERSAQDSTSTQSIFLVGFSAGAIASLNAAYMDQPGEKPDGCGAIGDVQHFFNFYPRPDLGPVEGTLNNNGHDATVMGVMNVYGAMGDTAWMEGSVSPALYSYHQTGDPIVGCGFQRPYWGIGLGVPDNYPYLHGSCAINDHVQAIGHSPGHYLFHQHNGNEHTVHDALAVLLESSLWMRELFCTIHTGVGTMAETPAPIAHPNPVHDRLYVAHVTDGPLPFQVFDTQGRLIRTGTMQHAVIDVNGLARGTYQLRLRTEGQEHVLRFVVAP